MCDNKSIIFITKNLAYHSITKHIDIKYHFIRELVANGEISLKFCGTEEQVADSLTKSLSKKQIFYLRRMLRVSNFKLRGRVEE